MCELFGISAAKQIPVDDLLREFYSHCDQHPNGWGLATFSHGSVSIEKEPIKASRSVYLKERLNHKIKASTLLAHIRLATIGNMEYDNSHPFVKRDDSGRCWVLIHNGTIFDYPALSPYQYRQEGETDSERILLYLVDQINQEQAAAGRDLEAEERFALLDALFADLSRGNKLNLILYDGELMYVHTNYANSLHVCEGGGIATFSTVPLKAGCWKPLPFTALCAYRNGQRVFQGQPHGHEYIDNVRDLKYLYAVFSNL